MDHARSIDPSTADPSGGIAALAARIERSPIRDVSDAPVKPAWAPDGYDETDIRILEWIAAHRRSRTKSARLAP